MDLHAELQRLSEDKSPTGGSLFGAVLKRSMLFPLTSVPIFFGICALVVSSLFGGLAFFNAVALWMGLAAGASLAYNMTARRQKHIDKAVFRHEKMRAMNEKRKLSQIQRHFLRVGTQGEEKQYREQAAKQLRISLEKFDTFRSVLRNRFQETELTYDRYLGAGREVFHHIVDNLNRVLELFQALNAMDVVHIEDRLKYLNGLRGATESDQKEVKTLNQRHETWRRQWAQVADLLRENEESLTAFSDTVAALNELDLSQTSRARFSGDTAMRELKALADRAQSLVSPG